MRTGNFNCRQAGILIVADQGLTVTFPYPEKVKEIIDNLSGENRVLVTENMWPRAFQEGGWDRKAGINHHYTVDTNISEMVTYKVTA